MLSQPRENWPISLKHSVGLCPVSLSTFSLTMLTTHRPLGRPSTSCCCSGQLPALGDPTCCGGGCRIQPLWPRLPRQARPKRLSGRHILQPIPRRLGPGLRGRRRCFNDEHWRRIQPAKDSQATHLALILPRTALLDASLTLDFPKQQASHSNLLLPDPALL